MGSDIKKLHGSENDENLRIAWDRLDKQVLDYALSLLRSRAYIDHTDEISSPYALVPIIVYCFDKDGNHLTDVEIRKMVKWFYYSQVRTRYVGQLAQKLDRDLRIVLESKSPFDELLGVIAEERPLPILPDEFVGRPILHPLFNLMRLYFKARGAVCFSTGLNLRQTMGRKYQLENDHIFPYSKLEKIGYGRANRIKYSLAQELTNRAILTQKANRTKSNADPDVYLKSVPDKFPEALALQCIPADQSMWTLSNYEGFIESRRRLLAKELNAFLEGITTTETEVVPVSIEDMIAEGESDEVEFKSSLRWDYKQEMVNKKLEEVIVKSVAAFANAQGGTLLVGVDDEGQILGLDRDYGSLGNADRDKFEVHLRNILNQNFGKALVTTKIQIQFHPIGDKEVCRIEVSPVAGPVLVKFVDKNGQAQELFYVRSGNSSQELSKAEMLAYLNERASGD